MIQQSFPYRIILHCLCYDYLTYVCLQVGVSGIHLYRQICLSGSQHRQPSGRGAETNGNKNEGSVQRPSILLRLVTHPYTPALITTIAIALLTNIRMFGIIHSLIYYLFFGKCIII